MIDNINDIEEINEVEDVNKGWFVAGIMTILIAVALPFIITAIFNTKYTIEGLGKLGAVGDFFGGSTIGLLSIASIFFIIHTIGIQSTELSLQRKELRLTRDELTETRKVHQEANHTQLTQRFETTFFNILSLQNEIVNNLQIKAGSERILKGREATAYLYKKFSGYYQSPSEKTRVKVAKATTLNEKFYPVYNDFIEYYGDYIGPYFRNIEILVYSIENSDFTKQEKNHYLDIIKAQMTKSELKLLFYNTAFSMEYSDSEEQLIGIEFFKGDLDPTELIHIDHKNFLSK